LLYVSLARYDPLQFFFKRFESVCAPDSPRELMVRLPVHRAEQQFSGFHSPNCFRFHALGRH
jgi:hypothetical protein